MSIIELIERRANRAHAEAHGLTLIEDLSPAEQKAIHDDMEAKARYVRTAAGVRRFKRPIGAIILPRGLGSLDRIRIKDPVFKGFDLVEDRKGNLYDVGKDDSTGKYVALKHNTWDDQIKPADSLDDALAALNEKLGGGTNSDREEGEKPAPKAKKPAPKKAPGKESSSDSKPQSDGPSKSNTSTAEIVDGKFVITTPDGKKHTRTATGKKPYTHALIRKNKEGSGSDSYFVSFATDEGKARRESRIGAADRAHNEIIELPTSGNDAPSTPEPKKTPEPTKVPDAPAKKGRKVPSEGMGNNIGGGTVGQEYPLSTMDHVREAGGKKDFLDLHHATHGARRATKDELAALPDDEFIAAVNDIERNGTGPAAAVRKHKGTGKGQAAPAKSGGAMGGQGSKERDAFIESHPKLKDVNDYHKPKLRDLSEKNFEAYLAAVEGGKSPDSIGAIMSRVDPGASWNPTTEKWSGQNSKGRPTSPTPTGDTSASDAADAAARKRVQKMKDEERSKGRTNPYTSSLTESQKASVDNLTPGQYAKYMNRRDAGDGHYKALAESNGQADTDRARLDKIQKTRVTGTPDEKVKKYEDLMKALDHFDKTSQSDLGPESRKVRSRIAERRAEALKAQGDAARAKARQENEDRARQVEEDRETMRQHEAANFERAPFRRASNTFRVNEKLLREKNEPERIRNNRLRAMEQSIKEREMRLATERYSGNLFERDRTSYQASIDRDKKILEETRAKEASRSKDKPSSSDAPKHTSAFMDTPISTSRDVANEIRDIQDHAKNASHIRREDTARERMKDIDKGIEILKKLQDDKDGPMTARQRRDADTAIKYAQDVKKRLEARFSGDGESSPVTAPDEASDRLRALKETQKGIAQLRKTTKFQADQYDVAKTAEGKEQYANALRQRQAKLSEYQAEIEERSKGLDLSDSDRTGLKRAQNALERIREDIDYALKQEERRKGTQAEQSTSRVAEDAARNQEHRARAERVESQEALRRKYNQNHDSHQGRMYPGIRGHARGEIQRAQDMNKKGESLQPVLEEMANIRRGAEAIMASDSYWVGQKQRDEAADAIDLLDKAMPYIEKLERERRDADDYVPTAGDRAEEEAQRQALTRRAREEREARIRKDVEDAERREAEIRSRPIVSGGKYDRDALIRALVDDQEIPAVYGPDRPAAQRDFQSTVRTFKPTKEERMEAAVGNSARVANKVKAYDKSAQLLQDLYNVYDPDLQPGSSVGDTPIPDTPERAQGRANAASDARSRETARQSPRASSGAPTPRGGSIDHQRDNTHAQRTADDILHEVQIGRFETDQNVSFGRGRSAEAVRRDFVSYGRNRLDSAQDALRRIRPENLTPAEREERSKTLGDMEKARRILDQIESGMSSSDLRREVLKDESGNLPFGEVFQDVGGAIGQAQSVEDLDKAERALNDLAKLPDARPAIIDSARAVLNRRREELTPASTNREAFTPATREEYARMSQGERAIERRKRREAAGQPEPKGATGEALGTRLPSVDSTLTLARTQIGKARRVRTERSAQDAINALNNTERSLRRDLTRSGDRMTSEQRADIQRALQDIAEARRKAEEQTPVSRRTTLRPSDLPALNERNSQNRDYREVARNRATSEAMGVFDSLPTSIPGGKTYGPPALDRDALANMDDAPSVPALNRAIRALEEQEDTTVDDEIRVLKEARDYLKERADQDRAEFEAANTSLFGDDLSIPEPAPARPQNRTYTERPGDPGDGPFRRGASKLRRAGMEDFTPNQARQVDEMNRDQWEAVQGRVDAGESLSDVLGSTATRNRRDPMAPPSAPRDEVQRRLAERRAAREAASRPDGSTTQAEWGTSTRTSLPQSGGQESDDPIRRAVERGEISTREAERRRRRAERERQAEQGRRINEFLDRERANNPAPSTPEAPRPTAPSRSEIATLKERADNALRPFSRLGTRTATAQDRTELRRVRNALVKQLRDYDAAGGGRYRMGIEIQLHQVRRALSGN